jgi:hypothetical protein
MGNGMHKHVVVVVHSRGHNNMGWRPQKLFFYALNNGDIKKEVVGRRGEWNFVVFVCENYENSSTTLAWLGRQ